MEKIIAHRVCQHNQLKYYIKWKGWDASTNTWELESNIFANATELISVYWHNLENKLWLEGKTDTIIRDVQGEISCPHFNNEPERLYRKR